jgi:hypothetical protein
MTAADPASPGRGPFGSTDPRRRLPARTANQLSAEAAAAR